MLDPEIYIANVFTSQSFVPQFQHLNVTEAAAIFLRTLIKISNLYLLGGFPRIYLVDFVVQVVDQFMYTGGCTDEVAMAPMEMKKVKWI